MAIHLAIPVAAIGAAKAYLIYRGVKASLSAIKAAIRAKLTGADPYAAAIAAGATALAASVLLDFVNFNF